MDCSGCRYLRRLKKWKKKEAKRLKKEAKREAKRRRLEEIAQRKEAQLAVLRRMQEKEDRAFQVRAMRVCCADSVSRSELDQIQRWLAHNKDRRKLAYLLANRADTRRRHALARRRLRVRPEPPSQSVLLDFTMSECLLVTYRPHCASQLHCYCNGHGLSEYM